MTDLIDAARTNDADAVRRLLDVEKTQNPQLGVDRTKYLATENMQEACNVAARHNHSALLVMLLDSGCWILPTTIIQALEGRSKEVIDALISHGWDVNMPIGHMGDALLVCVGANDVDMVQFLLSRGADPNANISTSGSKSLEKAAFGAPIAILDALLKAGAQHRSALPNAAGIGRTDLVAFLLDRGVDIDAIPNHPNIPNNIRKLGIMNALCKAAWRGQTAVVEMLLERGADPRLRDTNQRSAVELAEMQGHAECVNVLRRFGAV